MTEFATILDAVGEVAKTSRWARSDLCVLVSTDVFEAIAVVAEESGLTPLTGVRLIIWERLPPNTYRVVPQTFADLLTGWPEEPRYD